jgi:lipopolysaccharide export system protein LptA
MNLSLRLRSFGCGLLLGGVPFGLLLPGAALAERADKDKPTQIESNRMSSDEARRMSIFEGNVVLTRGTLVVRADRIVVRQDAEGYQFAEAAGKPVRFRQKGDAKGGRDGVWTEGEALRIVIDDRNERVELFDRARVTRDQDVVNGEYIFLDQRTEFFSVSSGKGAQASASSAPQERVKVIMQPKNPEAAQPPAAKPEAPKPAAK